MKFSNLAFAIVAICFFSTVALAKTDTQSMKDAVRKQFATIDAKLEGPVTVLLECAESIDAADFQILVKKLSHPSAGQSLSEAIRYTRLEAEQQVTGNHAVDYAQLQREDQQTAEAYFRMFVLSNATKSVAIVTCMSVKK